MQVSDDMPLPMQVGTGPTREEVLERLRSVYARAFDDVTDRVLAEVLLPDDQAAVCLDIAQFTTFLMAVKIAEIRHLSPTVENLFKWYWPMAKALKDEVPGMLRQHAAAAVQVGAR